MWNKIVDGFIYFCMPAVMAYHLLMGSALINTAAEDSAGLEKVADAVLAPVQYAFCGKVAVLEEGKYRLCQRFNYDDLFPFKMTASCVTLPVSLPLGAALKGIALLSEESNRRRKEILAAQRSTEVFPNTNYYRRLGLDVTAKANKLSHLQYRREEGAKNLLLPEKALLQEMARLFEEKEIPYWVDCGTLMGAYRYGGAIPWDDDVDVAVLLPDFDNVWHALQALDPEKYHVQDWSNRCRPKTYIRVYIKENRNYIDVYHFAIDPAKKTLTYVLSNEISSFMTEGWKIREGRYKVPSAFETIFPLKKADFDGIEVFVPNNTEKYLQERYGNNISPAKIYNEITKEYEKDLSHPYWQNPHVK